MSRLSRNFNERDSKQMFLNLRDYIASIHIPTATDLFGGVYIFRNKESNPYLKTISPI